MNSNTKSPYLIVSDSYDRINAEKIQDAITSVFYPRIEAQELIDSPPVKLEIFDNYTHIPVNQYSYAATIEAHNPKSTIFYNPLSSVKLAGLCYRFKQEYPDRNVIYVDAQEIHLNLFSKIIKGLEFIKGNDIEKISTAICLALKNQIVRDAEQKMTPRWSSDKVDARCSTPAD